MSDVRIPWAPRVILAGRAFRLPVQAPDEQVDLEAEGFERIAARWASADSAVYHYLRAPQQPGDYTVRARRNGRISDASIQVRTLADLRRPHAFNGAQWPRRWPVGQPYESTKTRRTIQDFPRARTANESLTGWWTAQDDETLWRQLPPAELPRAHFVNVHHGCPKCGTAVFRFGGFYPWKRSHQPCDFRSECPSCGAVFPGNDLVAGDFTSGDCIDDGYGYTDPHGHLFLFAATYHRDQVRAFGVGIGALAERLRAGAFDEGIARQLGLMLLRYAVEECYLASAPQFRYGPSKGEEEPWGWGQPDWATASDPVAALNRKGTVRYSIDTPYIAETLALAYDTVWPLLREDADLVRRAQGLGVEIHTPAEAAGLIEEMLAVLLQCILDRGAGSNLPRESQGALVLLRALDCPNAQDAMDWLYDDGPDTLRVFTTNDFFPDGAPPEATGGYNSIHTDGVFDLEYHLRLFRQQQPDAYPESRYPSLVSDPRTARVARQPHEITMVGKSWFQFGDGSAPGTSSQLGRVETRRTGSIRIDADCFHAPLAPSTLEWAAAFTGDPVVQEINDAVRDRRHRQIGPTVHDGVGIAVLRTPGAPERAAAGIVYGDTTGHRHRDLLDVQLFACGRPFLTDLGYPQSWASIAKWEAHWATHNTVWGALPGDEDARVAGRGRVVRTLFAEGIQILDVAADRWARSSGRWQKAGVTYRRLIALVETDGEGVALIDLSRIRGGTEHWRICRGLEGDFESENAGLVSRPGTVADAGGARGDTGNLPHPDYDALAFMDDVASAEARPAWRGGWQSGFEPDVHLDLHQLNVTPGAELLTARATAVMGAPNESNYRFRTVLWRRKPRQDGGPTCVDLVFEPRTGNPTLSDAKTIAVRTGAATAAGVDLTTRQGKRIVLYWAPDAGPEDTTEFEDGTQLRGGLTAVVDGDILATGTAEICWRGETRRFENARQVGRIVALDRQACTIHVEGLGKISVGDRIRVNPNGRGHTYLVEIAEGLDAGRHRLKLDVSSVLGRAPVVSADAGRIELGFHILSRTGNLRGTRLQAEADGAWAEILNAENPDRDRTVLQIKNEAEHTNRLKALKQGEWAQVVDYVVGDPVLFEPLCRS